MDDPTPEYIKGIRKATTAKELVEAIQPYSEICGDALQAAEVMEDKEVKEFQRDWRKASKPQSDEWTENFIKRFGMIVMPSKLLEASLIAEKYHAPWGVAFIRMQEIKK